MTDLTPDTPSKPTDDLSPDAISLQSSLSVEPHLHTKPANTLTPWVVTLLLHGIIFSGAYVLYQRAVKSNQALAKSAPALSATAPTVQQKDVLLTLRDSSTPIAINQETYAPAPKVRADLPVLTTADIIAQGNAIRAAQEGDKADSAVSATALTTLSATSMTASSTAKTTLKTDSKTVEKTTTVLMDASDEALTDRDIPAKDRKKNSTKTANETDTNQKNTTTKADKKADKKGTTTSTKGKTEKTDQAHQNSTEADKLSKELDETNADLSRNIDIVKNKNRQKIAKEFNTKPTPEKADDSLHDEDIPAKK